VLLERPAAGHVYELHPAAYPQHGEVAFDRRARQRDLEDVALGRRHSGLLAPLLAVAGGIDVRAAGEQQAIDQLEHLARFLDRDGVRGEHHGQAAGVLHRLHVAARQQNGLLVPDAPLRLLQRRAQADDWAIHSHTIGSTPAPRVLVQDGRDSTTRWEEAMSEQSIHTELQTVNVHRAAGAATIELNRPEKLNAWNHQFGEDLLTAVNGPAVGIGCSLALCCDLILAAESAYLLLAFVNIGLVPDGGSSLFVPTRVGMARAAELSMLGERLPARKALEWGLINRVVDD